MGTLVVDEADDDPVERKEVMEEGKLV